MTEIPTLEPVELSAGDRWQWRREDLADFPAGTWTLTYYFKNATAEFSIAATADGDDFAVDVGTATTAAYPPGAYKWRAYVTATGDRQEVACGSLEVLQNFAIAGLVDTRTHARKTLDAIEAVIENRATKDQESYSINGRSLSRTSMSDLLQLRNYYAAKVRGEEAAERRKSGRSSSRKIHVRF